MLLINISALLQFIVNAFTIPFLIKVYDLLLILLLRDIGTSLLCIVYILKCNLATFVITSTIKSVYILNLQLAHCVLNGMSQYN